MSNVKNYKDLTSDEKRGRDSFNTCLCTNCFKTGTCTGEMRDVCLNAYTKGFAKGIKYHRKFIKNKNKKN